ncbi:MAG: hypothetical protein MR051_06980 [Lentisphaeria bacterium]|nr:hypothetical protein [Lentisphaeria bacterium]
MLKFSAFRHPSARRYPGYFWIINQPIDMAKIRARLRGMAADKVRTVCLHPVPENFRIDIDSTMSPPYLSEEYHRKIAEIVDCCAELGMNYYLYDEGGWPSGGACGQVWAADPEKFTWRSIVSDGDGGWKIVKDPVTPELAAPRPNLLEKGATEKFLELTHEGYRRHCGRHFGKTVHMAFTDEPLMPLKTPGKLGYCSDLFAEFRRRKGYALEDHLHDLLTRDNPVCMRGPLAETMIDYCEVMSQLFSERFLLPLRAWCRKHHLLSAGHFGGEDEWLNLRCNHFGGVLHSLRQLDCPGVDMIWHQLYPGERLHPFPKLASSAARQTGKREVLGEMFAIYGGGLTPAVMKYLVDYMLVCGVNTFVFSSTPEYTDQVDLSGGRPAFGPCDPLWMNFDLWHTYVARMSVLLTSGNAEADTAFYFDQRAIWLGTRESEYAVFNAADAAERLRRRQCDFDFIDDESILAARFCGGKLRIGSAKYARLVLPGHHRMSAAAAAKVAALRRRGFPVLTPDDIETIPPTLAVFPATEKLLVHKRALGGGQAGYMVMNTAATAVTVKLQAREDQPVAVADCDDGTFHPVPSLHGAWEWTFAPWESRFFLCAPVAAVPAPAAPQTCVRILTRWRLRPLVKHEVKEVRQIPCGAKAIPAKTGDWRPYLGEDFSGTARYTAEFRWNGTAEINFIDLGQVNYTAAVKLNGREIGRKFCGPFVFDLRGALRRGRNRLEITVANTLANALSPADVQEYWKKRRKVESPYNTIQLGFEKESLPSGLFGPVRLMK